MSTQLPLPSLSIIPTPIGNLGDISLRALEVLKAVDVLLCEDTRNSGFLLKHYQISKPLQAYHQHNEHLLTDKIIAEMQGGKTFALLTDAGTPGISDPGFLLIRACHQQELALQCLPGATAFVPALVQSGLPCDRFVFEGFLPLKKGRQTRLLALQNEERSMVFYESPYRLVKTLEQFRAFFGAERQVAVCRELTKLFEETKKGSLEEVIAHFSAKTVKGEIVIVLEGKTDKK